MLSKRSIGLGSPLNTFLRWRLASRSINMSARVWNQAEPHWTAKPSMDRELPDPFAEQKQNRRYFWAYGIGVTLSCVIIFNYEKTRSPIINSSMYFLRRSDIAKEHLGKHIAFASSWPWIWGTLNAVKGNVDILFKVSGSAANGTVLLKAKRESKLLPFNVEHFLLEVNGEQYDLTSDPAVSFLI
ncbi:uncharacterized protein PRCAT00002044001 [Priceomyces carsonii]|uniref:uncharacterized protein n=1 Tax=Priceomyces carsonii TaxID=28549 RepID=UPI002EDA4F6A|nr:unnamed protein product [Priceomyces carsonii]